MLSNIFICLPSPPMDHVMMNSPQIDTRAPFNSVKEAVALFGHTVLAAEIYATKLKDQMHGGPIGNGSSKLGTVAAELEETKYNLQKAREESTLMANCMCSLKEELETTKRELEQMKEREIEKLMMEFEIEDVPRYELNGTQTLNEQGTEFQKKRYVSTFANQPSFSDRVIGPQQGVQRLERHPSLRKKKKKNLLMPLIGGLFSKKK